VLPCSHSATTLISSDPTMIPLVRMVLYYPSKAEASLLLTRPTSFRGSAVIAEALPPTFLLERATASDDSDWLMPRLFVDESSGEIVGSACFITEPKDRKVEIGYGVSTARRGRGFASEGVTLMIQAAFGSGLVDEVLASSLPANTASRRVLEKCGFQIYGAGMDEEGPVELWFKARRPDQSFPSRPAEIDATA
jgi:RimJ/RimL family protein N-acetyltransferase